MDFNPPITRKELMAIARRNPDNKDVIALLWEIKRLHAIVMRLDQLIRSHAVRAGAIGMILDAAEKEIANDPVVLERKRLDELGKDD